MSAFGDEGETSPGRAATVKAVASTALTVSEDPPTPAPAETATLRVPDSGMWVAVLESVPKAEHDLAHSLALAEAIPAGTGRVEVIDSDRTPGLNGGYWVIIQGDFVSRSVAAESCAGVGRDVGGECYPRLIG